MLSSMDSELTDFELTPIARAARTLLREALAPLQEFLEDPACEEIMVNCASDIWVIQGGIMRKTDIALPELQLEAAVRALATLNDRDVVEANGNAILNTVLDGNRVAACLKSVAIRGTMMCVRLPRKRVFTLDEYLQQGFFSPRPEIFDSELETKLQRDAQDGDAGLVEYLKFALAQGLSVLVSGSTSTGKTALLNLLISFLPSHVRVICCEDTKELQIPTANHVRLLEDRQNQVGLRQLIEFTLRLRPDAIIAGEVRGSEAADLIAALNTGHFGMGSLHANSARDALTRVETMMRRADGGSPIDAIQREIATGVQLLVHIDASRDPASGKRSRFAHEVLRVRGMENGRYLLETVYNAHQSRVNQRKLHPVHPHRFLPSGEPNAIHA